MASSWHTIKKIKQNFSKQPLKHKFMHEKLTLNNHLYLKIYHQPIHIKNETSEIFNQIDLKYVIIKAKSRIFFRLQNINKF